jgi:hypothetical protein
MGLVQAGVLILCAILSGFFGRFLTEDEKEIYSKRMYFPLFKLILLLVISVYLFIDKNTSFLFLLILITVEVWDPKELRFIRK